MGEKNITEIVSNSLNGQAQVDKALKLADIYGKELRDEAKNAANEQLLIALNSISSSSKMSLKDATIFAIESLLLLLVPILSTYLPHKFFFDFVPDSSRDIVFLLLWVVPLLIMILLFIRKTSSETKLERKLEKVTIKIDEDRKVGEIAQTDLREVITSLVENDKELVRELTTREYAKDNFGQSFAILSKKRDLGSGPRYYKEKIEGSDYYLTSQWVASQKDKLVDWINKQKNNKKGK
ncbi:hypothetical protein FACS1894125_6390 [Actinomycetota bacterium]|nr:hypothetical protein FACS1894125_6390 [Actinomycetota bacterium]